LLSVAKAWTVNVVEGGLITDDRSCVVCRYCLVAGTVVIVSLYVPESTVAPLGSFVTNLIVTEIGGVPPVTFRVAVILMAGMAHQYIISLGYIYFREFCWR
jgi:hypothetical protein